MGLKRRSLLHYSTCTCPGAEDQRHGSFDMFVGKQTESVLNMLNPGHVIELISLYRTYYCS